MHVVIPALNWHSLAMMPEYTGQCSSLLDKFQKQNHMHSKHFRVRRKCLLCFLYSLIIILLKKYLDNQTIYAYTLTKKLFDNQTISQSNKMKIVKGEPIMLEKLKEIIADQLNVDADSITAESRFKEDLEADSLDLFELVMALEEEYGVEIPSEDLEKILTVQDVIDYMKNKGVEA